MRQKRTVELVARSTGLQWNCKEVKNFLRYFIGIDIGTSSVKSLIIDENGNLIGISQREYDIIKPQQSYSEQDMNILWSATSETLRDLMTSNSSIKNKISGIGFSGQMHGLVMLDKNGKLIRNAIIWADQRSQNSIEKITNIFPTYRNITFNSLSTGFLISSLIWIRDNEPKNYEKIFHVMLPKDYIRYKICGELGTDYSDASGTGIFDIEKQNWAYEIIEALGIDKNIFVECHEASEIAGRVSEICSNETGLNKGIPVVYGGGDTLVQALGNGINDNVLISNIGTASQLLCLSNIPLHDKFFRTNTFCHVEKNKWLLMGANLSGGVALKWLKNILGCNSYSEMTELALKAEAGSKGLIFLPYLNGERTPHNDPNARGIFFGLSLSHGRNEIIRSTMEGIIFAQRETFEIFKQMGLNFNRVIASGGGARSEAFKKILASSLNCEVITNRINEQGCVGAAILSMTGTKTFSSIKEACEKIISFNDEVIKPNLEQSKIYDELFTKFQKIYPSNKGNF